MSASVNVGVRFRGARGRGGYVTWVSVSVSVSVRVSLSARVSVSVSKSVSLSVWLSRLDLGRGFVTRDPWMHARSHKRVIMSSIQMLGSQVTCINEL